MFVSSFRLIRGGWSWRRGGAHCCSSRGTSSTCDQHSWLPVIGLEVHAQISSRSKLFSPARASHCADDSVANRHVDILDAALPGTLPVLNIACVQAAVKTALALNMIVNTVSTFDRKHYFYADMPLGYQITQQNTPLARGGYVSAPLGNSTVTSKIQQLQLEMDSGKSLHDPLQNRSLIDLNRAGVGLMELVFAADLSSGDEAVAIITELALLLRCINTCTCRMAEGALRVDANVSVRQGSDAPLGVRTEIKNLNSIKSVGRAIDFEVRRQRSVLSAGGRVINETRSYDAEMNRTIVMRDKEVVQDYRFLPEPNLPPLRLSSSSHKNAALPDIELIRGEIPELPAATRQRIVHQFGISMYDAQFMYMRPGMLEMFSEIMRADATRHATDLAFMLRLHVLGVLNANKADFTCCRVPVRHVAAVFDLWQEKELAPDWLYEMLAALWQRPDSQPRQLMLARQWSLITDRHHVQQLCLDVSREHHKQVRNFMNCKSDKKKQRAIAVLTRAVVAASNNRVLSQLAQSEMMLLLTSPVTPTTSRDSPVTPTTSRDSPVTPTTSRDSPVTPTTSRDSP